VNSIDWLDNSIFLNVYASQERSFIVVPLKRTSFVDGALKQLSQPVSMQLAG
jgi:hypothetical protein